MSDRWFYGWGLGYAAVGAASLLVPLYALQLNAGALLVGLIAATAAFAGVPGALLWGNLAARTARRRPFVLVALGSTAAVLALIPFASSATVVLVLNAVLWFVVSAAAPVLNLVVVEGVPESQWNARIGKLNAYQGYGWVVGLVLGTIWTSVATRWLSMLAAQRVLLFALAALAAVAVVLTRAWYPERPTTDTADFRRVYRRLTRQGWGAGRYLRTVPYGPSRLYWALTSLRRGGRSGRPRLGGHNGRSGLAERFGPALTQYFVAAALFSVGFAVFWGPMPAYLDTGGFDTQTVFVLFLLGNLGSAVCYTPVGSLSGRYDPSVLQAIALGGRALLFPGVVLLTGVPMLAGVPTLAGEFVLIGVTWAVIAVTASGLVTKLADASVRGEALGIYTAVVGFATGVGSALGGWLADFVGYELTFVVAAGFVVVGIVGLGVARLSRKTAIGGTPTSADRSG